MKDFKIKLHTIEDIRNFVTEANMQGADIDVVSGRYVIDAKSILGLFSLDLSKPLTVVVHGTERDSEGFFEAVRALVVAE